MTSVRPSERGQLVCFFEAIAGYEEGDIRWGHNYRRIRHVHAQCICNPRKYGLPNVGHLPDTGWFLLYKKYLQETSEYSITRLNYNQALRVHLATGTTDLITTNVEFPREYDDPTPAKMDVDMFFVPLRGRTASFGSDEYNPTIFFGTDERSDHEELDVVWNHIETGSRFREVDHKDMPNQNLTRRLVISVPDFDNRTRSGYESRLYENDEGPRGALLKKRKHRLTDWRALPGINVDDVLDRRRSVDIRRTAHDPPITVKTRT